MEIEISVELKKELDKIMKEEGLLDYDEVISMLLLNSEIIATYGKPVTEVSIDE